MRITQSILIRNTISRVYENRDRMNSIQQRLSSQKKLEQASDNPVGYSKSSRYRNSLQQNEQFLKNIADADNWADTTSTSMEQLHEYAMQAIDLGMQATDGRNGADIRETLVASLRGLMEDAIAVGNTQYLGKSIFAGTNTKNSKPFEYDGTSVNYSGNDEKIYRRMTANRRDGINVTGQELMDTGFYQALADLINGLEINDDAAISDARQRLDDAEDEILSRTSLVGAFRNDLELIKNRLNQTNIDLQQYISEEEDANLEEELVKLKAEQIAYQAALQSTSDIMQLSILNYMK